MMLNDFTALVATNEGGEGVPIGPNDIHLAACMTDSANTCARANPTSAAVRQDSLFALFSATQPLNASLSASVQSSTSLSVPSLQ